MQRSEELRGLRKITLGLGDARLVGNDMNVVRSDIKNLIKLVERFGKPTKPHIGNRVLGQEVRIPHVEPLGLVEIELALVPLAAPSSYVSKRFRDTAVIGEKLACLLKIADGRVVILQATVVVIASGQHRLAELGLKSQRRFGCLPGFLTKGGRALNNNGAVAN